MTSLEMLKALHENCFIHLTDEKGIKMGANVTRYEITMYFFDEYIRAYVFINNKTGEFMGIEKVRGI